MEDVQALESTMRILEGQLEFERGQWNKLQGSTRICWTNFSYLTFGKKFRLPIQESGQSPR